VDKVLVDGAAVTPTTPTTYAFPALAADRTISVSFASTPGPTPTRALRR
jgi:hypothetical protein